jgi:hypothetical protein
MATLHAPGGERPSRRSHSPTVQPLSIQHEALRVATRRKSSHDRLGSARRGGRHELSDARDSLRRAEPRRLLDRAKGGANGCRNQRPDAPRAIAAAKPRLSALQRGSRRDLLSAEPIERCRLIRLGLRCSGHPRRSVDDHRTAMRRSRWRSTGRWRDHRRSRAHCGERRNESCDTPLPRLQRQHRRPPSVPVPPEPRADPIHAV